MTQSVRAVVFNADEAFAATLRADLLTVPGLQIVAMVDELSLLRQAIEQFPTEAVVIHLDPDIESVLPAAAEIAERHANMAVLVVSASTQGEHILRAMRAGVREFLNKPIDRGLLTRALDKLIADRVSTTQLGTLISVFGTIGGAGASSLAVNLAVELNDLCKQDSVALVDLDFRYGQLATMLDVQAEFTIADLSETAEQCDPEMIRKAMVRHTTGVHLVARPNHFEQADQISTEKCGSVLAALQRMYSYVVVDGPNRFDPGGLTVIDLADRCVLLIQLLVTSVRNAHRMLGALRTGGYDLAKFWLVCNRVGRDAGHLDIASVEKTLDVKIAHQIPDDFKTMSDAINMGAPLLEGAPKSRVRAAIRELAEHVIHPERVTAGSAAKKGLLGKVFRAAS